jgi:hypothetical protein
LQLLGTLGTASRRQSRLSISLQQQEIGLEAGPPRRPGNPVAAVPENCNIAFGLGKPNTYDFGSQESHLIHVPRLNHRGHRDHGENPVNASGTIEFIALNLSVFSFSVVSVPSVVELPVRTYNRPFDAGHGLGATRSSVRRLRAGLILLPSRRSRGVHHGKSSPPPSENPSRPGDRAGSVWPASILGSPAQDGMIGPTGKKVKNEAKAAIVVITWSLWAWMPESTPSGGENEPNPGGCVEPSDWPALCRRRAQGADGGELGRFLSNSRRSFRIWSWAIGANFDRRMGAP